MSYEIIADLHTHTVASLHAFSTVKENIASAEQCGLKYMAITDHFFGYADALLSKNELARVIYGKETVQKYTSMQIIDGGVFNLNHHLSEQVLKKTKQLSWRLLGLHSWFLEPTKVLIQDIPKFFEQALICNDNVMRPTAFAHIERELYEEFVGGNLCG